MRTIPKYEIKELKIGGKVYYKDTARIMPVMATPEEYVRQCTVKWLMENRGWPLSNIMTEYNLKSMKLGPGKIDILLARPSTDEEEKEAGAAAPVI